ncbi:MAG TPA: hypothetical protein VJY66_01575, partial [Acholeplasma sp.]|nr:hypothetical protein [Acholeplasma sp.]
ISIGASTDTYDHTGTITAVDDTFDISIGDIKNTLDELKKETEQMPPMYSAIKINGKKLYEYVRNGQTVEVPKRPITIYDIKMISDVSFDQYHQFDFFASVSKGTYIRTIAHDFGTKINLPCHLSALRRVNSGLFDIKDAYQLDMVNDTTKPTIDLMDYAKNLATVQVSDYLAKMVKNGTRLDERQTTDAGPILVKDPQGNPIAIYIKDDNTYKPIIQF